jgi:hypothetical protein
VRLAPQIGQVALVPDWSGCMKVAQPFVLQNRRVPALTRRMRRRAAAPKLVLAE